MSRVIFNGLDLYGEHGGGGGHEIVNAAGTSVAQENKLKFATMKVEDDSTNGQTVVRHIVELTQAQYDALPSSKLTDNIIYHITDQDANPLQASDITYGTSNVATELTNLNSGKVDTGAVSEYVETIGETAQGTYAVGEYFLCTDGYFYRCKSAITGGSTTITTNNAEQTTIRKELNTALVPVVLTSTIASASSRITVSQSYFAYQIGKLVVISRLDFTVSAGNAIPYNSSALISGLPPANSTNSCFIGRNQNSQAIGFRVYTDGCIYPASYNNVPANSSSATQYSLSGCYIAN